MKKLFLTSGIIACMACPAFADITANNIGDSNGQTAGGLTYPVNAETAPALSDASELSGQTVGGACVQPVMGVYTGDTTMSAQWTPAYHKITLVDKYGTTTATGGANQVATAATNLPTGYTTHDLIAAAPVDTTAPSVYTDRDTNDNLNPGIATGLSPFTGGTSAAGINVNYVLNTMVPTNHNQNDAVAATSTAANRTFLGFYNANDQQVIDGNNALVAQGTSDARSATTDLVWTAKYDLASPTNRTDPSIDGYTFNGWATTEQVQANEMLVAHTSGLPDIGEETTYYARWTPIDYAINFNCNFPATNGTVVGPTGASQDGTSSHTITMDASTTINETCSAQGWTFTGWTCTDDAGALYTAQDMQTAVTSITAQSLQSGAQTVYLKAAGNVSCTANWTAQTIDITWDKNNATSADIPDGSCSYNGSVDLPANPTRTGYEFTGWAVNN